MPQLSVPAIAITAAMTVLASFAPAQECNAVENFVWDRQTQHLAVHGEEIWIGSLAGGVLRFNTSTEQFTRYTRVANGLADNWINDIAVGSDGVVWIATNFGVSFFDLTAGGDEWTTLNASNSPLNENLINAVAVDASNAVWIGTYESGLYIYDGKTWQQFTPGNSGLSDQFVTSIEFDLTGAAWIGAWSSGVDRFDGETWTNFNPQSTGTPNGCNDLLLLPPEQLGLISVFVWVLGVNPVTGEIWFQDSDDGLCGLNGITSFDGNNWRTYTALNSNLANHVVTDVGFDASGTAYFAALTALSRFENKAFTSLPVNALSAQGFESDLFAGSFAGLSRVRGNAVETFVSDGLPSGGVYDIAVGPAGEVWTATNGGAARQNGTGWETFDPNNSGIAQFDTRSIEIDANGTIYIGTASSGLSIFDGENWQTLTTSDGAPSNWIRVSSLDQNGHLWVGSELLPGLARYNGSMFIPMATGLPSNNVYAIETAPNGDVWVGTNGGVARFRNGARVTFTEVDGLASNQVRAIGFDTLGNVWFGTSSAGASRFDGATFTNYSTPEGLPGNHVRAIAGDGQGRVWAGFLNESLAVFDEGVWSPVDRDDGLVFNRVRQIVSGENDQLWVATEIGISLFATADDPRGDVNCDGLISVGDIGPFVIALTDPAAYAAQFPGCDNSNADTNCDGAVTVGDIGSFVALLAP